MTSINDLKALLYDDVKDNNNKKEEMQNLKTRIMLFKDLIDLFDTKNIESIKDNLLSINIILDCLYDKKTKKSFKLEENIYAYLSNQDKTYKENIKNILYKIKLDANFEINKFDNINKSLLSEEEIITTRKIISSLKFSQIITDSQKEFINNRLKRANVDIKDIIIILERINIHNANVLKSQGERIKYGELYSLINLLNQEYELIELPNINSDTIDDVCNKLINSLESNPDLFEELLSSFNFYPTETLEYIYKKILIYYQNCMFDTIESLKDEDCYFDKEIIMIIKQEYYNYYTRYMMVRNKLDELNNRDTFIEESKEESKELYFSSNNYEDPSKCYFIKDLKDIREESLNNILKYLEELKKGISNKLKPLTGHHGYSEIKDDQVRIVFRPVESDKIIVLGVFIKKDNNDRETYNKIIDRSIELNDPIYSKEVWEYFENYVKENARKGTRK